MLDNTEKKGCKSNNVHVDIHEETASGVIIVVDNDTSITLNKRLLFTSFFVKVSVFELFNNGFRFSTCVFRSEAYILRKAADVVLQNVLNYLIPIINNDVPCRHKYANVHNYYKYTSITQ